MTAQKASAKFQQRQAQLLKTTYLKGWRTGVRNYRSQHATPPAQPTSQTGTSPQQPNAQQMSRALAPALSSLARMGAQIAVIVPTAVQIAAAGTAAAAVLIAVKKFLKANAWLLAIGLYVAWAGEQHGYAQAAAADGLLLEWELDRDPRVHHCSDCPALAELPPMPLGQWPTLPGEGLTECNVGCKCSMRTVAGVKPPVLTGEQLELLSRIGNRQPVLV